MNHSVATIPRRPLATAISQALSAIKTAPAAIVAEDEPTSVNAELAASPELDAAVEDVIAQAKALELLEPVKAEVPKVDLSTIVEFVPVKNKIGRYRIVSTKLRQFIHDSTDTGFMSEKMLESAHDTEEQKAARLRISLIDLESMFRSFYDFASIDEDDVKSSASGLTWPEYKTMFDDLAQRHNTWQEMRRAAVQAKHDAHMAQFNSGVADYESMLVGLKQESVKRLNGTAIPYVFDLGGQKIVGKITNAREQEHPMMGKWIEVRYEIHTHNGIGLSSRNNSMNIQFYEGVTSLESVGLTRLDKCSESVKAALIARGEKYLKLHEKPAYVMSTGNITRKEGRNTYQFNAKGRAMVDILGHRQMDTNYYAHFHVADPDDMEPDDYIPMSKVDDYIKMSCSPYLYGFSFKAKLWGEMSVDQITEIQFRDDVYDKLVLDDATKRMIFAQVTDTGDADTDLIAGKGVGCIALLEGPPGVGKTLTAEAVSETLKRPIYYVSVGELGTSARSLESNLKEILEIAASWNAILLLDEGDVFLERRDSHDLERNAMVAVFLRLLEYFPGIMFLTTNRADNIDPAFESRITLCIHYKDLESSSRFKIWTNLLNAAKIKSINTEAIDRLSHFKLNGRQIKQVIKSAGALARFEKRNVAYDDFMTVIQQKEDFKKATVYQLGKGLTDDKAAAPKAGVFRRVWDALVNNGKSLGQGQ
jgi:hypothetical protein